MSTNLNLVIYQRNNGKLIEEDARTIRCEEITPALLNIICDLFPMKKEKVYFDATLSNSFEILIFDSVDIVEIIKTLHGYFHQLLDYESKKLLRKTTPSKNLSSRSLMASIFPDSDNKNPTEIAIARFRILVGIIGLFNDKQSKLSDDVGAVIKLD